MLPVVTVGREILLINRDRIHLIEHSLVRRYQYISLISVSLLGMPLAHGNALEVDYNGQSPANIVGGATSVTYNFTNRNVDDGSSLASDEIGTGFHITVDGLLVRADSGSFSSNGCSVDSSFPSAWACSNLSSAGSSQIITFTWNAPFNGASVVSWNAYCQEIPIPPSGTRFCGVNGDAWGSEVANVETVVCLAADGGNLSLDNIDVTNSQIYEVCDSINVGPNLRVTPAGNLALRAGRAVIFNSNTSVGAGGQVTVEIDPLLLP